MMAANQPIVAGLRRVAERHGATPAQVALAWVLAQGPHVVPVPGTKRERWAAENAEAAGLGLTAQDLAEIAALPRGARVLGLSAETRAGMRNPAAGAAVPRTVSAARSKGSVLCAFLYPDAEEPGRNAARGARCALARW